MDNLFDDLDDFLEEVQTSLENTKKGLFAVLSVLGKQADPNGNLEKTVQSIQDSSDDLSSFREELPNRIEKAEDKDLTEAIRQYLNGEL